MGTEWKSFWADVRRDYASIWPTFRDGWGQVCEEWRELAAEMRQQRQLTRRMKQRITGVENPTRRQWRKANRAILAEVRELGSAERHVLREYHDHGR